MMMTGRTVRARVPVSSCPILTDCPSGAGGKEAGSDIPKVDVTMIEIQPNDCEITEPLDVEVRAV